MAEWIEPKIDWVTNPKNPRAEDFNRIEGNIKFLKEEIEIKKGLIVSALNSVGISADLLNTHQEIANKITEANVGQQIITPGTINKVISKGFHDGTGYVKGDSNLKASNIKAGVSIFGITGTVKEIKFAVGEMSRLPTYYSPETVNGLPFRPNFIYVGAYSTAHGLYIPSDVFGFSRNYWIVVHSDEYQERNNAFTILQDGFKVTGVNISYSGNAKWIAMLIK